MQFSLQKHILRIQQANIKRETRFGNIFFNLFSINSQEVQTHYIINSTMESDKIQDVDVDVNFNGYQGANPKDYLSNYIYRWSGAINRLRIKVQEKRKSENKEIDVKVSLPYGIPFKFKNGVSQDTSPSFRIVVYKLNAQSCYPIAGTVKINNKQIIVDQNYSDKPQFQLSHFLGIMVHEQIRFSFLPRYKTWISESQKLLDSSENLTEENLLAKNDWKWGVPEALIINKNKGQELFTFMFTSSFQAVYTWWQTSTKQKARVTQWKLQYKNQSYKVRLYVLVPFLEKQKSK